MRTETSTRTLYKFHELSEAQKEKAVNNLYDINVDHEWWDYTYEDASNIGLKITSFDDYNIEGHFLTSAPEVAESIMAEHGETCETYITARNYMNGVDLNAPEDESEYDKWSEIKERRDNDFLKSLLEDYRVVLRQEAEYLQSSEAAIETIEANDYEFTEEGELA
jgi:hypothetical protein